MKDPTGQEHKIYLYKGKKVELMPFFLYEVCIYKYWNGGCCILGTKFFKSNKPINLSKYRKVKTYGNYSIEKTISLEGIPASFVKECNIPEYIINFKNRKNGTRRSI